MGAFNQSDQYWLGYVAFCSQTTACRNRVASRGLLEKGAGLRGEDRAELSGVGEARILLEEGDLGAEDLCGGW